MKTKTKFVCSDCGYESLKWLGKCPSCNSWSTFVEEVEAPKNKYDISAGSASVRSVPKQLKDIGDDEGERLATGTKELDRVLGGGIVRGSLVLVGGDPGIGKSTLLLQICEDLGDKFDVLYVSGEESAQQIKMRATRLGVKAKNLKLLAETNLDSIIYHANEIKPAVMIVDSIQTMYREEVASAPGSVAQVREATHYLMRLAKENNIAIFIVGHVTKEGSIAGPRVLEHMVDCVLYFEGERQQSYRILRTVKNRFGSTNEIGVFEMKDTGLKEVPNPSAMLISGRPDDITGSAIVCTLEGTRPMLAEIQALSAPTNFAIARRTANGIDHSRATMLVAILEKKLGYSMQSQDVYINVVGGLKLTETASDLALVLAVASNYKNFVIDAKTMILGEVGLTGEVRSISFAEKRIAEAKKLGLKRCIIPKENTRDLKEFKDIEIIGVETVAEAIKIIKKA
jgi:DNA repair protein RadA/Sms